MHGLVVNIATDTAPEVLLLVEDEMLHTCNNTGALRSLDGLCDCGSGQVRVWAKGFKISAARGITTQGTNDGPE